MLSNPSRPDHRELYFTIPGPLMISFTDMRPYNRPACNLEVNCHKCNWSFFKSTFVESVEILLFHLWDAHDPQPKPHSRNVLTPPGR